MIFNFFKKKRKLHLRHVLQVAILIEEKGIQFYQQIAQVVSDAKTIQLCGTLAIDEARHKKLFEDMLSRWVPLPIDEDYLESYIEKLKQDGLFSAPSILAAKRENLLKQAFDYEIQTADFYLSFEKKFPELWKQMHIHQLVIEERQHADNLKSLI